MEILKPDLGYTTLLEYAEDNKLSLTSEISSLAISQKKFNEFTKSALNFGSDHSRPFNRCLNFQARQARLYAIKKGWRSMRWDFPDFWSEDHNADNVKWWLETMDSKTNLFDPIPTDETLELEFDNFCDEVCKFLRSIQV